MPLPLPAFIAHPPKFLIKCEFMRNIGTKYMLIRLCHGFYNQTELNSNPSCFHWFSNWLLLTLWVPLPWSSRGQCLAQQNELLVVEFLAGITNKHHPDFLHCPCQKPGMGWGSAQEDSWVAHALLVHLEAEGGPAEGAPEAGVWAAEPEPPAQAGAEILEPGEEHAGAGVPAVQAQLPAALHEAQVVPQALAPGQGFAQRGGWLPWGMFPLGLGPGRGWYGVDRTRGTPSWHRHSPEAPIQAISLQASFSICLWEPALYWVLWQVLGIPWWRR